MCLIAAAFCPNLSAAQPEIKIEPSVNSVGRYQKLEMLIGLDTQYANPFDPDEVDLTINMTTPSGKKLTLPAFFAQDFERRKLNGSRNRANWYYPTNTGVWKARFAPRQTGLYSAKAILKDKNGTAQTAPVKFQCTASNSKGFLCAGKKDPRFFEFTEGDPFFAIGQNLAFIGEGQYVNLTKAEQIFATLAANGANFLRIWTCCQDWALAIEARKSAWGRSWSRNRSIVPIPGSENQPEPPKCVKIEGSNASLAVSPSHPVALRPNTRYITTGRFTADGPTALKVQLSAALEIPAFDTAPNGQWKQFRHEFVTGANTMWLGRMTLSLLGSGAVWLDDLSLKDAATGAELLVEAEVNRKTRGYYNQIDCFMLDELIDAAENNGIYLMLCLITRDLYMSSLSKPDSSEYQQATEDAKKFVRYAVARWGYSTSVASWEYFNEMDPVKPTDKFYSELGAYLEQIDIYRHLRTTSTWHPSARDCRHPKIDIGQLHHYMRLDTKENFKDEVAVLLEKTKFLRQNSPAKPVLVGEFGLATPKWGIANQMKQDTQGVHFHNSLWASAFAGNSGTAMFWWWDQLDRQDAYHHYAPLAAFLKDVSFAGMTELKAATTGEKLNILGYQGPSRAYLWLSDPRANWWNLVMEKQQPAEIKNTTIQIQNLTPGRYSVQWWDTQNGKVTKTSEISLTQGPLSILIAPFTRDIACKITKAQRF